MKGYRVYVPKERLEMVNQNVCNIETLTDIRDSGLGKALHGAEGQKDLDGNHGKR